MVKKQIVPCTKLEMDAILKAAASNDFYFMLFKVARKTGRRIGEYYDVQVKDVDLENGIMLTKVLKRKQKIKKEAILDDELVYLIQSYIQRHGLKLDDYLFRGVTKTNRKGITYRTIQNRIGSYAKKAEIPHTVCFHNFRHYFVTALFKKGWTYDKISKLTGHSSVGTLATYDHSVASDVAEQARKDILDI